MGSLWAHSWLPRRPKAWMVPVHLPFSSCLCWHQSLVQRSAGRPKVTILLASVFSGEHLELSLVIDIGMFSILKYLFGSFAKFSTGDSAVLFFVCEMTPLRSWEVVGELGCLPSITWSLSTASPGNPQPYRDGPGILARLAEHLSLVGSRPPEHLPKVPPNGTFEPLFQCKYLLNTSSRSLYLAFPLHIIWKG